MYYRPNFFLMTNASSFKFYFKTFWPDPFISAKLNSDIIKRLETIQYVAYISDMTL